MKTSTLSIPVNKVAAEIRHLRDNWQMADEEIKRDFALVAVANNVQWYDIVMLDRCNRPHRMIAENVTSIGSHAEMAALEVAQRYGLRSQQEIDRWDSIAQANE